jgi:hypothetical protein
MAGGAVVEYIIRRPMLADGILHMTTARHKRAAEIQDSIREVLLHHWDPIGIAGNPKLRDEYDSYIGGAYRILASSRSQEELISYLSQAEAALTNSAPASQEQLCTVASRLLSINVSLSG